MKHTTITAVASALLATVSLVTACGPRPVPVALQNREFIPLDKRENRCGPGVGSCADGECCSEAGFCGTDEDYCAGSQCQIDYSNGCDTFFGPSGSCTENVPRPKIGNVPYGEPIYECVSPGMMALTFDDGPYFFTNDMLDLLDELKVTATFFVAGNNRGKGHIDDPATGWAPILKRMYAAGHQIGSHTWTHRDLNEVNASVRRSELIYNEMALRNIFGWFPTYLRAPYLDCESGTGCIPFVGKLGYHNIDVNVDTKDFENNDPSMIQVSKDRFSNAVSRDASSNSYIVLAHDVQEQTVSNLTTYMVQEARARGYRLVTVGECLGDPKKNWYRTAPRDEGGQCSWAASPTAKTSAVVPLPSGAPPAASPPSTFSTATGPPPAQTGGLRVSPDQTCGGANGYTCRGSEFGDCCSKYGYCGSSSNYCGTGCNANFGRCDPRPSGIVDTSNGLCGPDFSATCANFGVKTCCSAFGFCGNSASHCGSGCQEGFGTCN